MGQKKKNMNNAKVEDSSLLRCDAVLVGLRDQNILKWKIWNMKTETGKVERIKN